MRRRGLHVVVVGGGIGGRAAGLLLVRGVDPCPSYPAPPSLPGDQRRSR